MVVFWALSKLVSTRIIDARCRLAATDGDYFRLRFGGRVAPGADDAEQRERGFLSELDRAGVRTAVAVAGNNDGLDLGAIQLPPRRTSNDDQARLQVKYPGRYFGVAGIDVGGVVHDPLVETRRCVEELGLRAVAIEPGRAALHAPHPADRRLYSFYELVGGLGVTLFLQTSGYYGGTNLDYAHPRWIDQLAADFPALRIVCGHGCYPFVREMIAVAVRREHVYASPDLYVFAPSRREWVYAVNKGLIADKFLYGSAYPLCPTLRHSVYRFLLLGWRARRLDQLLYRNAVRALALEEDERFADLTRVGRRYFAHHLPWAFCRLALHELGRRLHRAAALGRQV